MMGPCGGGASVQQVDEVIELRQTRAKIFWTLKNYQKKRVEAGPWKKHGILPV